MKVGNHELYFPIIEGYNHTSVCVCYMHCHFKRRLICTRNRVLNSGTQYTTRKVMNGQEVVKQYFQLNVRGTVHISNV